MTELPFKIPPRSRCNATALRMASRKLSHLYDLALAPLGLRSTQFALLAELGRRHDRAPSMKELAEALAMDRSTLGQNMLPLERDGFVETKRDLEDGRSRRMHLTEAGKKKLKEGLPLWATAQNRFEEAVGSGQSEELRNILLTILGNEKLSR